ncbi:MAG: type IV toxin-antitoxin system AbiEi family antitoxin domain-containing protein [Candidatus Izemoplasmatales bacterium]|nr:type IV toxin-antitoxin system AbiEi family antitoxin domain-containing protein [Candidatus Izemoplasmatales bacterium]
MMSKKKLEELIKRQNGYITTQDAIYEGIHREYLTMFVEEEKLIRTSPGVYQSIDAWEDKLYAYQQKKKHMIYSHDTALFLHGLSDRDPIQYSVTLPTGYNTSQIKQIDLITYTIKTSLFQLGKMTMKSPFGNDITVYDKERTICDIIRSRSRIDQQILNDGLKRYVKDKSKNLNNLLEYAKKMGIDNVLRNYLEILL